MPGTWNLPEMSPCHLPEKVATGFSRAFEKMVGSSYIPVLYCGKQIVHGTNHMLICKQTMSVHTPEAHLTKVVLFEPLPTDASQAWQIESIETII